MTKMIYLVALFLTVMAYAGDRLDFGTFFLIWFVAVVLKNIFSSDEDDESSVVDEEEEIEEEEFDDNEVVRIRKTDIEKLRNMLLRHHNSRGTDKDYNESTMSKDTTFAIQVLNNALSKKLTQAR
jgi:hypothetical protein